MFKVCTLDVMEIIIGVIITKTGGDNMPNIEILGTGFIDQRDSAFPQAVQLSNGDILCSFNVGGGHFVTGGTDWARSCDGGYSWDVEGSILPATLSPPSTNALKLSISSDRNVLYAYGSRSYPTDKDRFGHTENEAVFCSSNDQGKHWSEPQVVPFQREGSIEVSHGILPLSSGRMLAPAATLPEGRLGEKVLAAVSDDGGRTWCSQVVIFKDPEYKRGYFEQKLAEISPGTLLATAWTVTFGDVKDMPNSFVVSTDDGTSWSAPVETEFFGQTMTPVPIDGNKMLILYNKRYGAQAVMMALVTFTKEGWITHLDKPMWDSKTSRDKPEGEYTGVEELKKLEFGFPTAIKLDDGTFLATHWTKETGVFGVRWTKLRIDW
tara:strand:+ start:1644 stop:2780 length:1137 start_codon:yes stop_codon:yes gene_type:complete